MAVKAYFQTGEDKILQYCRNAGRNVLKQTPPIQVHFFNDWVKFKADLVTPRTEKVVIILPEIDIEPWMSPVTSLPDFVHPVDNVTYVFGANSIDKWKPMIDANRAEIENESLIEYVTIPTDKLIYGHIAAAIVFYDRKLKS